MTPLEARTVRTAIAECNRYIRIEAPRSADLRPPEIAKRLAFYYAHKAKLEAMLAADCPTLN